MPNSIYGSATIENELCVICTCTEIKTYEYLLVCKHVCTVNTDLELWVFG